MKTLTISRARNSLPALLNRVVAAREQVIITRHGKPLARIMPVDSKKSTAVRHPLRGLPLETTKDFNEPMPEMWSALES